MKLPVKSGNCLPAYLFIAVTAFAYASDEQKAKENGFDDYMAKPINAGQLRNKVMSMLQRHIVFM